LPHQKQVFNKKTMQNILVIGAGRSSSAIIDYLLAQSATYNWTITVADASLAAATQKIDGHPNGRAVAVDITDAAARADLINAAVCVASLLPPSLHDLVAADCLALGKNLVTASYLSKNLLAMADEVTAKGLLFMGEMGLDPGIDHLSAMQVIDDIKAKGGKMLAFRSYTGGIIAPECEGDNPWGYKFSWNPKNVITAGQGVAQFIENGKLKFRPYQQLFAQATPINVQNMGIYDGYANRDSLAYRKIYNLDDIPTLVRGTLRKRGYCKSWNIFVQLGMCDDTYTIDCAGLTYNDFLEMYLPNSNETDLRKRLQIFAQRNDDSNCIKKIAWLGFFDNIPISLVKATPADILLALLLDKWKLEPTDKDMVMMQHEFEYQLDNQVFRHTATLVVRGQDQTDTAMAKLVGLPMAILVKLIMTDKIQLTGVHIPVQKAIYAPVLAELADYGVHFIENTVQIA
jgi:saccharopine dehydrogenase-like NADP-dependent oxidoreductase